MQFEFETASPTEMLETVFARLNGNPLLTIPVTRDGRLVGIMSQENIGEFLTIQSALNDKRRPT